ncbi:Exportin-T, partial [Mucuna pruriens]
MDDLEKAILIMFDESGALDDDLKKQAKVYCNDIKAKPSICRLCIEKLCFSNLVQVQFWCLQTLHEVIRTRYLTMTPDERHMIRGSVFSIVCLEDNNLTRVLEGPAFIKNKLAQVLITLIYFEYPLVWSSVFVDFFPHLSKGNVVIDMFCRVLNALDDELISLDYPRTPEELTVAGRVKDAMRQQCVSQIVRAWYDIVYMYRNSDQELCISVLDSMRRYISWIDIGLIVNDAFIPLLFDLILVGPLSDQLRGAAVRCLLAVVSKRMEPQSKLSLLQSLQISRVLRLVTEDGDAELVSDIAALLTGYAVEALDCFKRINSEDAKGISMELLSEVLPSIFYVMKNFEIDATFNIIQLLLGYVAILKSFAPLREKQLLHLGQILEVILVLIRYDPAYRTNLDVMDKIGKEEEDRMVEFRKDLFVLLRTVGRVAPDVTQLFIRNSLASAVSRSSDSNVEEVEGALSLLYALGESISEETIRTGSGLLSELVLMLLSTKFPCHSNRLVALVYLETVTRYVKFIQDNTQYIPMVLAAFLDERGIHHSNINVSRRASYLFMRVVKLLKMKLVPFIETILQSLQDTVAQFTIMNYTTEELSGSEDGSHIFEAIGLLIGTEDVLPEKQSDYLSTLLSPLCQQVEALLINAKLLNCEETNAKIAVIQQIIMAINSLSKGFSERLVTASRPAIGLMFKQTLDVLLQVLVIFPKVESLRNKVTSFIHRMVDTLGASVFPYLPKALEQLLEEIEPKQMVGFLLLLNQLICKFNTLVRDILEEIFPAVAERIFSVIPRNGVSSGPGAVTEEIRELQELQRTLYTFLHVITTHDLSPVFLSPKCKAYLDPVMQLLLYSSCNHKDILVRKVPGFRSFVIEAFATNCCLYSVLDRSFEFHDANT